MGIKGLLRFMKPYIEPIHIKKYSGKRVGVDAYAWLHKGAYSCSMELHLDSDNEKKLKYIDYFMHRINLLRHHKIVPVVIFDGGNIPCKAITEQERHRRRTNNLELANAKLKEGNVGAAKDFFQKAVSITPSMAHQLIQVLRQENVEFVVAPCEADAQLAYLSSLDEEQGGVVAVITEDSDLIAYGCKAIIFKMDQYGKGEEVLLDNVFNSVDRTPSFRNFDMELLTGMCVLAGCDFLPSVPGIGIVRSHTLVSKYRNLDRVLSVLKLEKKNQMPEDYTKSFREATSVFQHAQIYDVATKKLKHIRPLPETLLQSLNGELDFLGPEIPPSAAIAIAEGNLDPISMEAFDISLSFSYCSKPIRIGTHGRITRVDGPTGSTRESCSAVFSSQNAKEKDSTTTTEEERYITIEKVDALEKLIMPLDDQEAINTSLAVTDIDFKVPSNNPFKRRKTDQTPYSCPTQTQVYELLDIDVLEDGPERKKKLEEIALDEMEEVSEEISLVTENEKSEVLCVDFESQESVNYKPTSNINGGGKKKRNSRKVKTRKPKSSGTKDGSILNFFYRV